MSLLFTFSRKIAVKLPSDYKILECIFEKYQEEFLKENSTPSRSSKIYVPIDCKLIADELKTDRDIIFGRLYYHLEEKYGYTRLDGSKVKLFALQIGNDTKCINFALMTSILAGLREEKQRHLLTQGVAVAALILSAISLIVSLLRG